MTVRDAVERTIVAHEALAAVGEGIEDEWQYVADLRAAWRARLGRVAAERGAEEIAAPVAAAVAAAVEEAARIDDPHRAIDWLSTLPQVVLVALDEAP